MRRTTQPFRTDRPAKAELAAGAAVVDPELSELLLLHLEDEDRWCFPKGHVESGESVGEAAVREVEEETGLAHVRLGPEIGIVTYRFYQPRKDVSVVKTVVYFVVESVKGPVRPESGFDEARWVNVEAARSLLEFDADRQVLDLAVNWLDQKRNSGSPTT
jgi:8-oxo-dGTP pyrophosphatase MutT (NUDIX family)